MREVVHVCESISRLHTICGGPSSSYSSTTKAGPTPLDTSPLDTMSSSSSLSLAGGNCGQQSAHNVNDIRDTELSVGQTIRSSVAEAMETVRISGDDCATFITDFLKIVTVTENTTDSKRLQYS